MKIEKPKQTDKARGGSNKTHEEKCTCGLRKIATWQGVCDDQERCMEEDTNAYASDKGVNFLFNDSGALIEGDHETWEKGVSRYYMRSISGVACGWVGGERRQ